MRLTWLSRLMRMQGQFSRRDLLDVGRLAGAVVALDHDAPVVREAGQDGERRVVVEAIGLVQVRHVLAILREGRDHHVALDTEGLAHRHLNVGRAGRHAGGGLRLLCHGWLKSSLACCLVALVNARGLRREAL